MPGEETQRISLRQDLIWRLEAAAFAGFIGLMRLIGLEAASNFGGWVLRTLGPRTGTHRTVMRNLRIAFPDMDPAERDFPEAGEARYRDVESPLEIPAVSGDIRGTYQATVQDALAEWRSALTGSGARYALAPTDLPLGRPLRTLAGANGRGVMI